MSEGLKLRNIGTLIADTVWGDEVKKIYVNHVLGNVLNAAIPWYFRPFAWLVRNKVADVYRDEVKIATSYADLNVGWMTIMENRTIPWYLQFVRPRFDPVRRELNKVGIELKRNSIHVRNTFPSI